MKRRKSESNRKKERAGKKNETGKREIKKGEGEKGNG